MKTFLHYLLLPILSGLILSFSPGCYTELALSRQASVEYETVYKPYPVPIPPPPPPPPPCFECETAPAPISLPAGGGSDHRDFGNHRTDPDAGRRAGGRR